MGIRLCSARLSLTLNCNLNDFIKFHKSKKGMGTIALYKRDNPSASGIVLTDSDDQIIKFLEKPKKNEIFSNYVSAGILIFEPEIFNYIPENTYCDFGRDIFPNLISQEKKLYGYLMKEDLVWVDTPDDYMYFNNEISNGRYNIL